MLIKDIDPFLRQAVLGRITAKTAYDVFFKLRTPDSRLYYIFGGSGKMVVEGKPYVVKAGTVVMFRAGVEYAWHPSPDGYIEYAALNFDFTQEHSHLKKSYHPVHATVFSDASILYTELIEDTPELNMPLVIPESPQRESSIRSILAEFLLGGDFAQPLLSSMLKTLLISLAKERRQSATSTASIDLISALVQHIHKNYKSHISYESLGAHYHMNPIYLNRIFKRHFKMPLHEYLLHYRIAMAKDSLRSSNAPVKEIALSVGFSDIPHFSKSFKRITGYSPTEYRRGSYQ